MKGPGVVAPISEPLPSEWCMPTRDLELLFEVARGRVTTSSARATLRRRHWTQRDAADAVQLAEATPPL